VEQANRQLIRLANRQTDRQKTKRRKQIIDHWKGRERGEVGRKRGSEKGRGEGRECRKEERGKAGKKRIEGKKGRNR
jgi:hypothetical protein